MTGCVAALLGVCLVLTYRMAGVINFAQASMGAAGAFVMLELYNSGWAFVPAIAVGVLFSAVLAAVIGLIMLTFFAESSLDTKTGVTIGLLVSFLSLGIKIFGDDAHAFPAVLPGTSITISGVVVPGVTLVGLALAALLAAGMTAYLSLTRSGTMMRAIASRPTTAEVLGLPVRPLSVAIWAASGAVTTIAMIIVAPSQGGRFADMSLLILPGLAAALCGLFRNLPATVIGGVLIGAIGGMTVQSDFFSPYSTSTPFFVVLVILLVTQRRETWDAAR